MENLKNLTPYEHQTKCFELAKDKNFAVLMEQGTGKTPVGIGLIKHHNLNTLIVCPLSVVYEWQRQLLEFADIRAIQYNGVACIGKVVITTYGMLWRHRDELTRFLVGGVLILDESHYIKNPKAYTTQAAWNLGSVTKYKYILTGTPITNNPMDLWSQFRFLDPSILGPSKNVFEEEYGVKSKFNKVVDYKNLNELGDRIKPFSFRTTRKECLDLPPEVDSFLWVDLAHHAQHLYNRVNQQMKLLYDETLATGTDKYMGQMGKLRNTMQRICGGFNDEANLLWLHKIETTIEYVDNMVYEGHQIVIFAHYVAEVKTISQMLTSHGIYTPYICGETDLKDRALHIKDFQDGKVKVLVCQEQAGGVGITLTAADIALFYSMNFDAGTYEQAKARIYRIGQENPVTYVHLLAKGTVDEAILRVVKRKLKWADNTLSGIEEVLKCSILKSSKQ